MHAARQLVFQSPRVPIPVYSGKYLDKLECLSLAASKSILLSSRMNDTVLRYLFSHVLSNSAMASRSRFWNRGGGEVDG